MTLYELVKEDGGLDIGEQKWQEDIVQGIMCLFQN